MKVFGKILDAVSHAAEELEHICEAMQKVYDTLVLIETRLEFIAGRLDKAELYFKSIVPEYPSTQSDVK